MIARLPYEGEASPKAPEFSAAVRASTSPPNTRGRPLRFTCPQCGSPLAESTEATRAAPPYSTTVLACSADGTSYRNIDGIWHLLAPSREAQFRQFVTEYDHVRRAEKRGCADPEYFRRLPFEDTTGIFRRDWKIRAAGFRCFVEEVLEPLERSDGEKRARLRVLDLGAGNGWLSNRMAERGHEAVAVDLRIDDQDGLGAHAYYDTNFTPVRAEFDRLPFEDDAFELVVFNASFHYSGRYEKTLKEALRVLEPRGRIVVMDSPVYEDGRSGERMVRERTERFREKYGFASNALRSEEYLTGTRLRQLAVRCGVTWTRHRPGYGLEWTARRTLARFRNGREPARFRVLVGQQVLEADEAIAYMKPNPLVQAAGRAALRLRFFAKQRRRLRSEMTEEISGLRLRIPPSVFNPVIFRTGAFLAELILEETLPRGIRALDLGTGSGIAAIAAAKCGADVTAVDINPEAVECARENAARNDADIDLARSDLFDAVEKRFDVVLFNPPYFAGRARTPFERSWQSDDVATRFSQGLSARLRPGGFALIVLSSDGKCPNYLRRFAADGHRIARIAERRHVNETLTIFRLAPDS